MAPLVVQKSQPENISSRREAKKPKLRALKPRKYVEDCPDLPSNTEIAVLERIL
jgi:hypothetical protein